MDGYRLSALLHLFSAVLLVGLALFWAIMLWSLKQRVSHDESQRLLGVLNTARWPHVAVPYALRLRLPWMPLLVILVLLVTGLVCLQTRPVAAGALWWSKVALATGLVVTSLASMVRPTPGVIRANFVLVLLAIIVSAWLLR
jgi:hypothetical protein